MEVLSALLCDSAEDYQGKLCVLGAFDTPGFPRLSSAHPHCAIALRLLFRAADEGHHQFAIRLIDSDGRSALPELKPEIDVRIPGDSSSSPGTW